MSKLLRIANTPDLIPTIFVLSFVVISIYIYYPGISGTFLFDDVANLQSLNQYGGVNSFDSLLAFIFSNTSSPLNRPISMLSFLLNDQYWPGDPGSYKYTNILIHALCGLFIFLFLRMIVNLQPSRQQPGIYACLFATVLWLTHPLNVSTTLYIIQRMTQLSSLFTIVALLIYVFGRKLQSSNFKLSYSLLSLSIFPFTILAILSKETGALIFLYILILEFSVLRNVPKHRWFHLWSYLFVVTPIVVICIKFAFLWNSFAASYSTRDFTLFERLLTESRVLMNYLYQIIIPQSEGTGLFHDDFSISTGIFTPLSTFFSVAATLILITIGFISRRKQPILSFSILWFFGGHILESTVIPLEIYFEHRNYLPMLGPLFGLNYYVIYFLSKNSSTKKLQYAIPTLLIIISMLLTHQSATIWGKPFDLLKTWALEHPESLRAQRAYGQVLVVHNHPKDAILQLQSTYELFPSDISIPISIYNISCQNMLPSPYSVDDMIRMGESSEYSANLIPAVKTLIELNSTGKCTSISNADLHRLLQMLENVNKVRPSAMANLLMIRSDLYVKEGELSPAVETLDRALRFEYASIIPVRQAQLLSSAGLFKEALVYIQRAKSIENKKPFYKNSGLEYIVSMENQIKKAMKAKITDNG